MNTHTITRTSVNTFSFEYIYLRDTDYSFVQTTRRSDGKEFARKLEQGSQEYRIARDLFDFNGVDLSKGNTVVIIENAA